ncbi:MAG: secondary thiamine-phosphate synthase enzyme YjbQ [Agathobaculum sp.]|uniref:secondary thiamine-phosphate synthase enzyme YjbQ n=1 Tax=Agathobaculum sp. TaxID=2048138 RepID=UPI003D9301E1
MKTREFRLRTGQEGLYEITEMVCDAVRESGVKSGIVVVYCPHSDAGITINENVDTALRHDLMMGLDAAFPDRVEFQHRENNAVCHLKSSCVGTSCMVPVEDGQLLLGIWQGIFFCEFDNPGRRPGTDKRRFLVKIVSDDCL